MCMPIGILRCVVSIEAWIVMICGIAAFIFTMIMQIHYSLMLQAYEGESWMLFGQGMLTAFWLFSSYIIINGVCGVVGGQHKKPCLLLVFNVGNIIIIIAFILLMVIGYVLADETRKLTDQDYQQNENTCLDHRFQLNTLDWESKDLLCSIECPCYYTQTNGALAKNKTKWADAKDTTKPTRVQDCEIYQKTQNTTVKYFSNYLGDIQKETGCTGWCVPYQMQIFYDINAKVDNDQLYCQYVVISKLTEMGQLMGDIAAGVTAVMLVLITLTCCLCFHPVNKDQDFYKKMAHYEN
ncbi:unnamed protein product (macronuclear) [Paramecium tetraurelia]|uniref:Tetraspanin n=1 Tax=Paramecium tetraurelia TaxID=5888 RepID=A0BQH8_PARTE|nr:uncharacterized protein GSPATT00031024001 [Paramecium tetraurelia]CAK60795.1 unnamed protein product [Paramecium tetraurelia]|eukprot:XP_001428193.1 hypothetical protein (macronuclear) [Paramecium tetraurelia strain d4-2]